ncbi:MAG: hypothetical protein WEB06_14435 [Actinomycetota bacterium]
MRLPLRRWVDGPPRSGRRASECYPYTTIVGYEEFGYVQRPLYKRKPKSTRTAEFKTVRAAPCAELITRVGVLADADPRSTSDRTSARAVALGRR